jgi:hypothetical protein
MLGISCLGEDKLAFQEGFYLVELVKWNIFAVLNAVTNSKITRYALYMHFNGARP